MHFCSRANYQGGFGKAKQSLITKGGLVIKPGRRQVDRARAVHFRSRDRQSLITKGGSVIKPGRRQVGN